MNDQAVRLWERCRDSMRGWKNAILYFGAEALEEAYQKGLRDGKDRCVHKLAKEFLESGDGNKDR